jgi:hypothetical protein
MDQNAEASGSVSAAPGGLGGGEIFNEVGAEGLVLTVRGVLGLEEKAGEVCY